MCLSIIGESFTFDQCARGGGKTEEEVCDGIVNVIHDGRRNGSRGLRAQLYCVWSYKRGNRNEAVFGDRFSDWSKRRLKLRRSESI